ncbi:acyl-CoA dehydrogenase family protein [Ornithinimicrobium avium]|uniref:Acyl-CoA dehydrogenase n=1 Tax=Ornithinimicrobium avium TaxID=2283195 RepID=A0A345NL23_9MICO|nr:acyl-CoA dehydrogenase family protein [Ornithinimicrobium avium]AXH95731.1 acyl-CoA dehydrogenase [Ornithinimicrobium avium]
MGVQVQERDTDVSVTRSAGPELALAGDEAGTEASGASQLVGRFRDAVARTFGHRADLDVIGQGRGLPPFVLRDVLAEEPMRAFLPTRFGGFGDSLAPSQEVMETAAYHSLALGLTMGISGGLFAQPVAKYANPEVAGRILPRLAEDGRLGGLMITEPGHGTDALSMRTAWRREGQHYRVMGTKHWAGLSGWADYWLVMARPGKEDGDLGNGIDLFVCEQDDPDHQIELVEKYPSLGLYGIPYGRNEVDVRVPLSHRLQGDRGGLRLMMDLLNRSRSSFAGNAVGFIHRMVDEAVEHCTGRVVSGQRLIDYDQVRARIARLQGQWACASALSLWSSENAGLSTDLSRAGQAASAIKTVASDYLQESAQSLLQLVGAKGYALDHVAGRAVVDSRPFQIFEGSNDVLYAQMGAKVADQVRRAGTTNLRELLSRDPVTAAGADLAGAQLEFDVDERPAQRRLVEIGAIASRVFTLGAVMDLGSRGFSRDHVSVAVATLREDIGSWTTRLRGSLTPEVSTDPILAGAWRHLTGTRTVLPA